MTEDNRTTRAPGLLQTQARLREAESALLEQTARADRAEADAACLASYLEQRAGVHVWDHGDVMTMIDSTFGKLTRGLRTAIARARSQGSPASFITIDRILQGEVEKVAAEVRQRFDGVADQAAVAMPHLLTDRMRYDTATVVSNAARYQKAA